MTIANPIYDAVFKYLMEDKRIARTILSALLKENIIEVDMRPHEYSNGQRELLSVFRIDFGATILKPDGSEELILVELQKNWLPTETLRFRQYVGSQYQDPRNIVEDSADRHALPMVTVYLLGHALGDIEEPVLYVRHQSFDYNDRIVTKGMPNPFVESLVHDSVIVQIPRLHGQINNRLDEVLSVFDQTRADKKNQHTLNFDDSVYDSSDSDMQRILYRLTAAAADIDMRQDMMVEDEYYSIIKEQESKLYYGERKLAEMNAQLAEKEGQLAEKEGQLAEMGGQLAEKDGQLQVTIKLLLKMGQSEESIAESLGISPDEVKRLCRD
ncbi:MAG: hypothetical protein J6Y33_05140 [Prevotella sp.]|nr:hypothetical protein [Prevotella sp.]